MEDAWNGNLVERLTLENFSHRTGRHITPFFAGRRDLIEVARQRRDEVLINVRNGKRNPAAGVTLLFQGAPGAGKTSLLTKLQQCLDIPCIELEVKDLADPETVLERAEQALAMAGLPDAVKRLLAAAIGVSVGPCPLDASKIRRAAGQAAHGVIAVFIDEIQNVRPDRVQAVDCLRTLHEGKHGLRVLPVLAGLGNSPEILGAEEVGLSRLDPPGGLSVDRLTPDEARESVELFMRYFEVRGETGPWVESVARLSDLWPQHLHNGLRALAGELARTDADIDLIDRDRVERREREDRTAAYQARLSSTWVENAVFLVAELVNGIPEQGMRKSAIRKAVIQKARPSDDPDGEGYWIPDDANGFLDHLVHEGILQDDGKGMYRCPIPSLRAFLNGNFRSEPPRLEDMRDRTLALQNPTEITDPSPFKDTFG